MLDHWLPDPTRQLLDVFSRVEHYHSKAGAGVLRKWGGDGTTIMHITHIKQNNQKKNAE